MISKGRAFTKIQVWPEITHWYRGVYKIVQYNDRSEFYTYLLKDGANNWGDYFNPRPCRQLNGSRYFDTLREAMRACDAHEQASQSPTSRQMRWATLGLAAALEYQRENGHGFG